jgi:hypothetical protein
VLTYEDHGGNKDTISRRLAGQSSRFVARISSFVSSANFLRKRDTKYASRDTLFPPRHRPYAIRSSLNTLPSHSAPSIQQSSFDARRRNGPDRPLKSRMPLFLCPTRSSPLPMRDDNSAEALSDREFANSRVFDAPLSACLEHGLSRTIWRNGGGPKASRIPLRVRPRARRSLALRHARSRWDQLQESQHLCRGCGTRANSLQPQLWPKLQVTATFAEQAGKTQLTFRMLFESVVECERVKAFAVEANEQNFDRLAAQLEKMR